jgi:outer membrane protein TolC
LEVPLTTGGAYQARIARYSAEVNRIKAELERKKMEVRQAVVELANDIYVLRAQRDEMDSLAAYRDLYLDRSRGLYELDVKTDLGDAMVEFSNVRFQAAKTNYELALTWARLDALTGNPVYDLSRQKK